MQFLKDLPIQCGKGTNREEVGREKFLERVWEYKEEQGGHITRQLRSLGASADWSRERFTMDEENCDSVTEAFVRFHEKGLVYRGEYMVNWAPMLQTAVSDLEVEYTEEEGKLYFFKYMLENSDEFLPVATTRPETIMGDTAVCVNPNDNRFKALVGKNVVVPMSGGRTIPVIADEYVDIEFGTGALKITPGHDPNDYAIGKKFDLPIINIMNKDGSLNENAGEYNGLDRFVAREKLWKDMEEEGFTIKASFAELIKLLNHAEFIHLTRIHRLTLILNVYQDLNAEEILLNHSSVVNGL
jgi:valyl-tRNA synthetase